MFLWFGAGPHRKTVKRIRELVRGNKHQMKFREYFSIYRLIHSIRPTNVLVFGVGRDTGFWIEANEGGTTVFVENEPSWIEMTKKATPEASIVMAQYFTKRPDWQEYLAKPESLRIDLPKEITERCWDVILVDSPGGRTDNCPGRMQSIYTAFTLNPCHFFLHDCDRVVEREYFRKFFGEPDTKVRKLWYKRLGKN